MGTTTILVICACLVSLSNARSLQKRQTFHKGFPFLNLNSNSGFPFFNTDRDDDVEGVPAEDDGPSDNPFFTYEQPDRPSDNPFFTYQQPDLQETLRTLFSLFRFGMKHLQDEIDDVHKTLNGSIFTEENENSSTSNTTIVDGHVVTVNESVHNDEDKNFYHRVKVIYIRPTESPQVEIPEEIPEETPDLPEPLVPNVPQPPNEPESDSFDLVNDEENEIPNGIPQVYDGREPF